jgi:hypothetical protein
MESFLARMDAIDQQLREAQEEQEAQVELERAAMAAAGLRPRRCWCLFEASPGGCLGCPPQGP